MASRNPNVLANLKNFTSTYQPKNPGRKPSKLRKFIKDNGLSSIDSVLISKTLIGKSRKELKELAGDDNQPIWICGSAKALLEDMVKGRVDVLTWLAERAFGKPVQPIESKGISATIEMTPEERKAYLDGLIQARQNQLPGSGAATVVGTERAAGEPEETQQEKSGETEGQNN